MNVLCVLTIVVEVLGIEFVVELLAFAEILMGMTVRPG